MNKKQLYLWCARPCDLLDEEVGRKCAALMSEDERERWHSFRTDRLRREYLTTRALVRTALSYYHPLAPEAWRFKLNAHGKPAIEPECGLRFNLSNSHDLVVCLIAHGAEVGVDLEPCDRAEVIADLAPEVFSPRELAQFEALCGPERLNRALSLWTLKESYTKARGVGMSLRLAEFSFVFGAGEEICLELDARLNDAAERWQFGLMEYAGHRIAWMAELAVVPDLQLWNARPLQAPPIRLPVGENVWRSSS